MERKKLERFRVFPGWMWLFWTLPAVFFFAGCSVLSPVGRPGYVPSYVSEKCEAPVYREGDTWKFIGSDGQEWEEKVIASEGRLQPAQSQKKDFYGFSFSFGELELQKFFPLWVGKIWRGSPMLYTVEGAPLTYFVSLRVIDSATVNTKAGIFQCYVIELGMSYSREKGTGFYYYSPQTKSIVKFETQSPLLNKFTNYELSSYQVK